MAYYALIIFFLENIDKAQWNVIGRKINEFCYPLTFLFLENLTEILISRIKLLKTSQRDVSKNKPCLILANIQTSGKCS